MAKKDETPEEKKARLKKQRDLEKQRKLQNEGYSSKDKPVPSSKGGPTPRKKTGFHEGTKKQTDPDRGRLGDFLYKTLRPDGPKVGDYDRTYGLGGVQSDSYGGLYDRPSGLAAPSKEPGEQLKQGKWHRSGGRNTRRIPEKQGPPIDGGGSGGGTRTTPAVDSGDGGGSMPIQPSAGQPDYTDQADLPYWQKQLDYYSNREPLDKFQFDDTYAPDSQGFRDTAGYIGDVGKTIVGAIGASKKLKDYDPSDDFKTMMTESRDRRNLGLSQADRAQASSGMDRAYNYDVQNIRNMAGGSGGAALANLGGAANRYYGSQNQLTSLDQQLKAQNRDQFNQAAMAGESVNQFGFQEKRGREMMSKSAAGGLMRDSIENIKQRKEYEDTYLNPDSPYYQYQKELVLDTRQNRELKTFAEEQRVKELEQYNLDMQNEAQEEIERIERGKRVALENAQEQAKKDGVSVGVSTSDEFNEYNGEPVVAELNNPDAEYTPPLAEEKNVALAQGDNTTTDGGTATPGLAKPADSRMEAVKKSSENRNKEKAGFGYSESEMNKMSDAELKKEGITRKENITIDERTGEKIPGTATYSKVEDMPVEDADAPGNIEDDIRSDFQEKELEVMKKYYTSNPKMYKKKMAELKQQRADALKNKEKYQVDKAYAVIKN